MSRRYRSSGLSRVDVTTVAVVLGILSMCLWMLLPAIQRERRHAYHRRCGANLSEIGKAISVYANDYEYMPPIAGGPGTQWGPGLANWTAESRGEAFGLDTNDTGGQATISSSLHLLVRYVDLDPESFVCPAEKGTKVFKPSRYTVNGKRPSHMWDFGPDPARHCSYAYQMVYAQFQPQTPRSLVLAIVADRSPWIDSPFGKAQDFSLFEPDKTPYKGMREDAVVGNSTAHRGNGQNILYLDGHVELVSRSYHTIGGYQMRSWDEDHELESVEDDNIYTSWDGDDKARGVAPSPYESKPAHEFDSLLVNDPPLGP